GPTLIQRPWPAGPSAAQWLSQFVRPAIFVPPAGRGRGHRSAMSLPNGAATSFALDRGSYRGPYLPGPLDPRRSKRSLLDIIEALRGTPYQPVVACPGRGWLTRQLDERQVPFVVVPFLAWRTWLQRPRVATSIRRQWLPALAPWSIALVHSNEFWW